MSKPALAGEQFNVGRITMVSPGVATGCQVIAGAGSMK